MTLFKNLATHTLDALFPPRCFACSELVGSHGSLCGSCWSGVDFIAAPYCHRCGTPFELDAGAQAQCMMCLMHPPAYNTARAVFRYEGESRRLVAGYKYYDRTLATPVFARWLVRCGAEQLREGAVIVPVPLHPLRLLQRRYNQSALLAQEVGRLCGLPVWTRALRRTRNTAHQAGLSREARLSNVQGAFAVAPSYVARLQAKNVVLVDDVLTTGATLDACAEALFAAGAEAVHVLVLARAVRDDV